VAGAGPRGQVKVMVGGAPITQDYADSIGADGFSPDASRAVSTAKALIS
jgi:5-methyltetrahydrofolate--homocysteine methyltransferase